MKKEEQQELENRIVARLSEEFRSITETRINHSLRDVITETIREMVFESDEFKGMLRDNFSNEIKTCVEEETNKINIPMTVNQLALLTGLTTDALYQRKHRGTLNFEKIGGRIYMSLKDLYSQLLSTECKG